MLRNLNQKQLLDIIESENSEDLQEALGEQLFQFLTKRIKIRAKLSKEHLTSRSTIAALNTSMGPINVWWLILSTIPDVICGISAFIATISALALGMFLGVCYFGYSYEKRINKFANYLKSLQLAELKIQALDILIENKNNEIKEIESSIAFKQCISDDKPSEPTKDKNVHKTKPAKTSIMKSALVGTGLAAGLAITYVLGVGSVFEILGMITLSSVLTGPIGICVAAASTLFMLGIGIYLGYKHYQGQSTLAHNKQEQDRLNNEVKSKQSEYDELKLKYEKLKFAKKIESSIEKRVNSLIKQKLNHQFNAKKKKFSLFSSPKTEPISHSAHYEGMLHRK